VHSSDSPLRQYLQILKRQWWLLVLVPAVMVAATLAILSLQKPVYRASTTLVVGEPRGEEPPVLGSFGVTRTMTTLLQSDLVARSVINELDLDMSIDDFQKKLKVDVLPDTAVLDVIYRSSNRKQALAVVAKIASIFTRELGETLGVKSGKGSVAAKAGEPQSFDLIVRVFDPPNVQPVERAATSYVVFAAIGGLAIGLLLAVGREALNATIQRRKDAEEWFGAPVVGTLPKVPRRPPPGVGARRGRWGRDDERVASLDLLRARLQFASMGEAGPTILVTSAGSEAETSPVAASIGAALTWAGNRVVCVDADVRSPSLHKALGLPGDGPGLVDVLEKAVTVEEALITVDLVQPAKNGAGPSKAPGRLELLAAGGPPATLVGVLWPETIEQLKQQLHGRADYVVFDCPSLLVADALPLALQSDSILVVARRGRTTKDQAESVRETLQGLGVDHVGVVLTDTPVGDGYV
jgi:capsular polysaccharide biosynthesis protein